MNDSNAAIRNNLTEIKRGGAEGFFKNVSKKATELWNDAFESSEKVINETGENISELWEEANEKYDKAKDVWDKASDAEKQFFMDHPVAA